MTRINHQKNRKICIVYDEGIADYDFGPEYELKGDRFPRYLKLLEAEGVFNKGVSLVRPKPASDEDLLLVHSKDYLRRVDKIAEERGLLAEDNPLNPKIVNAARIIVGAALTSADLVSTKTVNLSQGVGGGLHHAGKDYGDGWCVYNDVAVAAQSLITRNGFERVMIFDTDAHAGNGTMDIFYDEPRVLYLGVHQDPATLFPNTGFVDQIGKGFGEGYTINVPLPVGADDSCMAMVLDRVFKPIVRQFRPQIIIRNGGADPHFKDELADLNLSYRGLQMIGVYTVEMSDEVGCGLVDLVCSGYNPGYEEKGLYALLAGEIGLKLDYEEEVPVSGRNVIEKTAKTIKELSTLLYDYWKIDTG